MYNNAVPAGDDLVLVTRGGGEAVLYSLPTLASTAFREEYEGGMTGYDPQAETAVSWENAPENEHRLTETFMTINGITEPNPRLYYSREGEYAAWVSEDGTIEVFRKDEPDQVFLQTGQVNCAPTAFGIAGDTMVAADRTSRMMFQNLKDGTMTVLKDDYAHTSFVFNGNYLMAAREGACVIDVYDAEKAEKLFSMSSSVPFERMGFSEDGNEAAAINTNGRVMTGNLWLNENALLEAARRFVPGQ